MSRASKVIIALGILAIIVAAAAVAMVSRGAGKNDVVDALVPGKSEGTYLEEARRSARSFLDRYLSPEGRVIRHDQGGDTVSEGQAYAMLLAVALEDRRAFDAAWGWARDNLSRPDSLLSWHWQDGAVADNESASDGDLDTAHALLLAAETFDEPSFRDEGLDIAESILDRETVTIGEGRTLVAGPWATEPPHVVNPSYFSPPAFAVLSRASGDTTWDAVAVTSYDLLAQVSGPQSGLPPDWAELGSSGRAEPSGAPSTSEDPRYGWDAVRVPIRVAKDCDERGREFAASMWPFFEEKRAMVAAVYGLEGEPLVDFQSAVGLVAAAAAAHAAGEEEATAEFLERAERLEQDSPTYYGAAWLALGRVLLTTDLLDSCP